MRILRALALFIALATPLAARTEPLAIICPDEPVEGRGFVVKILAPAGDAPIVVEWLDRTFAVPGRAVGDHREAEVLLGVGMRERNGEDTYTLGVAVGDWSQVKTLTRRPHAYPEQHLEVARKYTELSDEDLARHDREKIDVIRARDALSDEKLWRLPLTRPVPGVVTSEFGFRRFFNGEPKLPHGGVDLRAAEGDPVRACADGRVTLAGEHFFAGGSIYIDHGQGVVSMYFHLSGIDVEAGRLVRAGDVIGRAGETGRVTGPHLHWGLSVHGCLVDPLPLLQAP